MAGVFRSMVQENGLPLVGNGRDMLGVREIDIRADDTGNVRPGTGGLSVAPAWRRLPPFLIPARLRNKATEARGNDRLACFRLGDAAFQPGTVCDGVQLVIGNPAHGALEPAETMSLARFQNCLAITRPRWVKDED